MENSPTNNTDCPSVESPRILRYICVNALKKKIGKPLIVFSGDY